MSSTDNTNSQPKATLAVFRDIPDSKPRAHIKNNIRAALNDPKSGAAEGMEPYLTNGGVTGHSLIDMGDAVQILLDDPVHGPGIRAFKLKKYDVVKAVEAVLREKFVCKKHKIQEVKPELLLLMKTEKPEEPDNIA